MKININNSQVKLKDSFKEYIKESLKINITKYFEKAVGAIINFKKEGNLIVVTIVVNDGLQSSINVKSNASAYDASSAFGEALEKAIKQVRRYKRRIKNYKVKSNASDAIKSKKYIISATPVSFLDDEISFEENNIETFNNVIEEKTTSIETLSIAEAIMKMDLQDLPALVFINFEDQKKNVIYYRKDGLISRIEI
ncbi:HPF/RaiA family ribosome-associated protein [Flavobacteriaceae bacterium]|nr:HPF/RaiA family ribosome-associated protein [Flavobacteriaceae bacterium]